MQKQHKYINFIEKYAPTDLQAHTFPYRRMQACAGAFEYDPLLCDVIVA